MSFKNIIKITIFTILVSSLVLFVGFTHEEKTTPQTVYQVYLDGEKIGLIYNKDELFNLINQESAAIKSKYQVEQVYPPNGLEAKQYITYNENVMNVRELYEIIKEKKPFTVNANKITIKDLDNNVKTIYALKGEYFTEALNNIIHVFVGKEKYISFINDTQAEIVDTGSLLESIYFDETITMKKTYVSTNEAIFTSADEISQYLLFSTTEKQKTYVVRAGEDIETIAENNQLNPEEFLIANPSFTSVDQLLSPGQIVNIGLIKPVLNLIYEEHVVEDQESLYETEIQYDATLAPGVKYTKQEGVNGIDRISKKIIVKNGDPQEIFMVSEEEIKPTISKIIVRSTSVSSNYDDNSAWAWPTLRPYTISSRYGEWRWGEQHRGVDIVVRKGFGSPIYAVAAGTVTFAGWQGNGGYVINIDHGNGYFSEYGHLNDIYVKLGEVVKRKDTIGAMGKSGVVTGTHLHLGMWVGKPWVKGSYTINPLTKYK